MGGIGIGLYVYGVITHECPAVGTLSGTLFKLLQWTSAPFLLCALVARVTVTKDVERATGRPLEPAVTSRSHTYDIQEICRDISGPPRIPSPHLVAFF